MGSASCAELHRRGADNSTENLGEMTLVHKARGPRNAVDAYLGISQVFLGTFDSLTENVLMWAQPCTLFEKLAEVMWAHSSQLPQFPQPHFLCAVLPDEI